MLRVLMLLEDYGELMFLQTVLKKIGFDVDAIQNPRFLADNLLSLNPDVLVMTASGKRFKGIDLVAGVKRTRGLPHIILLRTPGVARVEDPQVEAWIDSPVGALDLLNCVADLCGLDKTVLADKFQKLRLQEPENDEARVLSPGEGGAHEDELKSSATPSGNFGILQESTMSPEERKDRYRKFLKRERPEHIGFSVKQVQDQVKSLRQDESAEELADLERERKAFVEHLFRKKRS